MLRDENPSATPPQKLKLCTKCFEYFPRLRFYRNDKTPDGLNHQCRYCTKARSIKYHREQRAKNPERYLAKQRAWRAKRIEEGRNG